MPTPKTFIDFLSQQPMDAIIGTKITPTRTVFPVEVDPTAFYKKFSIDIETSTLGTEKSIYIGAMHDKKPYIGAFKLLTSKLKYT